jgi:hypothetical protein
MITSQQLKMRTESAIEMQSQGYFVVDLRKELPLPRHESLERMRYSSQHDEKGGFFAYENDLPPKTWSKE